MNQTIKNIIEQINCGEVPDGYRKTGVGIFPTDWVESTLKKEGTFLKGCGIPGDKMTSAGIPCVGYGDLYMKYDVKFEKSLSFTDRYTALQSKKVDKGALLFTATGETEEEIGKCVCYWGDEPIYVGGDIFIFNSKDVEPLFVSYQQNVWSFIKQKARLGQGHSIVHIREGALAQLSTIYPKEKTKQQRIAEILMKWDDAVELHEKLVKLAIDKKTAVFQRVLSPQKEWTHYKISDVLTESFLKTTKNNEYTALSSTSEGLFLQKDYFIKEVASENNVGYKVLQKGQIVFSPQNLWLGNINYNDKFDVGMVSPSYKIFNINSINNKVFIKEVLMSHRLIEKYKSVSEQGASVVRRNLDMEAFMGLGIQLPSKEYQNKIAVIIDKYTTSVSLKIKKLEALKKQRKALRQLLLTGIVRV